MRRFLAFALMVACSPALLADWGIGPDGSVSWVGEHGKPPAGAVEYKPAKYTQAIFRDVTTGVDVAQLRLVPIADLEDKWQRSGGFSKDVKFTSRKFRSGGDPKYSIQFIAVLNSFGHFQNEQGLTRVYPDGARFDDILSNADGVVFEHRVREKAEGRWKSRVAYKNADARPAGYNGLKATCASCHEGDAGPGTGGYGVGLVPGGDGVLSSPMEWKTVSASLADYK